MGVLRVHHGEKYVHHKTRNRIKFPSHVDPASWLHRALFIRIPIWGVCVLAISHWAIFSAFFLHQTKHLPSIKIDNSTAGLFLERRSLFPGHGNFLGFSLRKRNQGFAEETEMDRVGVQLLAVMVRPFPRDLFHRPPEGRILQYYLRCIQWVQFMILSGAEAIHWVDFGPATETFSAEEEVFQWYTSNGLMEHTRMPTENWSKIQETLAGAIAKARPRWVVVCQRPTDLPWVPLQPSPRGPNAGKMKQGNPFGDSSFGDTRRTTSLPLWRHLRSKWALEEKGIKRAYPKLDSPAFSVDLFLTPILAVPNQRCTGNETDPSPSLPFACTLEPEVCRKAAVADCLAKLESNHSIQGALAHLRSSGVYTILSQCLTLADQLPVPVPFLIRFEYFNGEAPSTHDVVVALEALYLQKLMGLQRQDSSASTHDQGRAFPAASAGNQHDFCARLSTSAPLFASKSSSLFFLSSLDEAQSSVFQAQRERGQREIESEEEMDALAQGLDQIQTISLSARSFLASGVAESFCNADMRPGLRVLQSAVERIQQYRDSMLTYNEPGTKIAPRNTHGEGGASKSVQTLESVTSVEKPQPEETDPARTALGQRESTVEVGSSAVRVNKQAPGDRRRRRLLGEVDPGSFSPQQHPGQGKGGTFLVALVVYQPSQTEGTGLTGFDLIQWVEYHRYAGVRKFFWLDMARSREEMQHETLKHFMESGVVDYTVLDAGLNHTSAERALAVSRFLRARKHEAEWMMHLVVNEYVFAPSDVAAGFLTRMLQKQDSNCSQVSLASIAFQGPPTPLPYGSLLMERFQHRKAHAFERAIFKGVATRLRCSQYGGLATLPACGQTHFLSPDEARLNSYKAQQGHEQGIRGIDLIHDFSMKPLAEALGERLQWQAAWLPAFELHGSFGQLKSAMKLLGDEFMDSAVGLVGETGLKAFQGLSRS